MGLEPGALVPERRGGGGRPGSNGFVCGEMSLGAWCVEMILCFVLFLSGDGGGLGNGGDQVLFFTAISLRYQFSTYVFFCLGCSIRKLSREAQPEW